MSPLKRTNRIEACPQLGCGKWNHIWAGTNNFGDRVEAIFCQHCDCVHYRTDGKTWQPLVVTNKGNICFKGLTQ